MPGAPCDVVLDHVSFGYTPGREVIHDLSLRLPAGSVTALVGPSGSGKSTIARLVARFWDASSGSASVGGVDVRAVRVETLMERVSMVFQDVCLFDTTIEEIVRIGRPGASEAQAREAAEREGPDEVVERLPHGWNTRVGEGGSALSGDERQRVAIARAFLKDAPVLLLDEVTSALDGANEAAVTRAMEELGRGRTVLVIAHRLSTIRRADRIVGLADGAVEAAGTHEGALRNGRRLPALLGRPDSHRQVETRGRGGGRGGLGESNLRLLSRRLRLIISDSRFEAAHLSLQLLGQC